MSVLREGPRHFVPGCPHEVAHRALAGAVEDRDLAARVVGVGGVGCGSLTRGYLDLPIVASPTGRAVSVARGLLLQREDLLPVVYGGDGELLGEGLADLLRGAAAGAPLLVLLVDNAIQAGGGRLVSPTTPAEAVLPSCPEGRGARHGRPLSPRDLLGGLDAVVREVGGDLDAARAALGTALAEVAEGRGMQVLWLRATCPAAARGGEA